ncbi:hypothetical protein E1264_26445 [Actinomadura sp. KC216]|uniref:hypothetical protein n=1 Tax=Actinomadura sp. KC216 TaxID=2530370 RepID=UPI001044DA0D|nr:hypothetical protein [Actinomadura sp. KC216]TDB83928.1 hypothetical protein E1264_26445 [Actinomadura sp. KC216]
MPVDDQQRGTVVGRAGDEPVRELLDRHRDGTGPTAEVEARAPPRLGTVDALRADRVGGEHVVDAVQGAALGGAAPPGSPWSRPVHGRDGTRRARS